MKWESFEKTCRVRREMVPHLPQSAESFEGRRRDQYHVCSITSPPERMGSSCIWRHKRLIGIAYNGRKYRQCFQHGNNSSSSPPVQKEMIKWKMDFPSFQGGGGEGFVCFFKRRNKDRSEAAQSASKAAGGRETTASHLSKSLGYTSILFNILRHTRSTILLRLTRVLWPRQSTT